MSRSLSGGMAAHIATRAHNRVRMLRIDLADGSTIAVSDHDRPLAFDLGDGAATYSPATGILPSDLALSAGFETDDLEVSGPLVETAIEAWHVTRAMVLGGRFDDASARFFMVNWKNTGQGAIELLKGYVHKAEVEGGRFKLTVHSEVTKFRQEVGRTITGYCDADFGDARCGYTPETLAATVIGVTDARTFDVAFSGTFADDYWNRGTAAFLTGGLAGTRPVEIFDFAGGTDAGSLALWADLAEAPQVGDTLTIAQGCEKTRAACLLFDNVANFRGFPDVPGTDQVLRYPNPSA